MNEPGPVVRSDRARAGTRARETRSQLLAQLLVEAEVRPARGGAWPGRGALAERVDALRRELVRLSRSRYPRARLAGARMAVEAIELLDPLIERAARTDIRGDLLPSVAEFGDALARLRRDHAVTRPPLNSTDTTVR